VGAILDPPVAAVEGEQSVRVGLRGSEAGNGEDGLVSLLAGFDLQDVALDAADLGDMGKVDIVVQCRGGEQLAALQAPVALIEGLAAPGGNARAPAP
jgi:pantothenate kinase